MDGSGAPMEQDRPAIDPDLKRRLMVIVSDLASEATRRVGEKSATEEKWIEDLCAYHGRDDDGVRTNRTDAPSQAPSSSRATFNRTRRKTRAMGARLKEMLFPADDSNWSIEPTPAPSLTAEAERATQKALEAQQAAAQGGDAAAAQKEQAEADRLSAVLEEASTRCEAMRREIDDMLVECRYEAACRKVIDDAAKLGAGIIKGPVLENAKRRPWVKVQVVDPQTNEASEEYQMAAPFATPTFRWVDPWSFFPAGEDEGDMERHLMKKSDLRALAREPGFDKDAIRRLLIAGPDQKGPDYIGHLRNIAGDEVVSKDIYQVWEYNGPIDAEKVADVAMAMGDQGMHAEAAAADPLDDMHVNLWFCRGEILKAGPYTLDSGESLYSMFVMEAEEQSRWGKGIPRIMRDPQIALKAGWRAMLDNGGYALGPHIVLNPEKIEPADGNWDMRGPKIWHLKGVLGPQEKAFDQFQVNMNQEQLANIIGLAERFIDEETGLPQIATGEQTEPTTKTVGGMALLISQGNLTFREIVKRFDDGVTVPNLQRAYDWKMQFGENEAIKGDYKVHARGVSALVMREIESQNLLMVSSVYGADDPDIKGDKVKRAVFRALSLDPEEYIRTPTERAKWIEEQQQGPSDADIKQMEMEVRREETDAKIAIAEMETASRLQEAEIRHETAMMSLAETANIEFEKLEGMLRRSREDRAGKERIVAVETAMSEREQARAAQQDRDPMGSGGYIA